ncbi:hypothetical protein BCR43DRAFT_538629 [Syncephalastrum racemosum]|uniref:F-box domain-containing protein n=1 Tax=Syncephalastrum racemosum TaxID=13706 RepID=A0A1X2H1M5_SYNRA|nr:hypothetical protein BCR43DRAFT_538629 [Syncephalastrum racemosum]
MLDIPDEVLYVIGQNLPTEDLYACLGVCRQWRLVFSRLFWRSVYLQKGANLAQFLGPFEAWAAAADVPVPILMHVRKVKLQLQENEWAHVDDIKILSRLCVHLQSLEVHLKRPWPNDQDMLTRLAPLTSTMFPSEMACLTRLYLDLPEINCHALKRTILPQVPHLVDLHLDRVDFSWGIKDMEVLHGLCPRLESIDIVATVCDNERVDRNIREERNPAKHLHCLRFRALFGLEQRYLNWVKYVTKKYRRTLEDLSLAGDIGTLPGHPDEVPDARFGEDDAPFNLLRSGNSRGKLRYLRLPDALFRERVLTPGLRHVSLTPSQHNHLWPTYYLDTVDASITSVKLECYPADFEPISDMLRRAVPNLTHLDLNCEAIYVELDTILSVCSHLNHLFLESTDRLVWDSTDSEHHTALQQLSLTECFVEEEVFVNINRHCINLAEIVLNGVALVSPEADEVPEVILLDLTGLSHLHSLSSKRISWSSSTDERDELNYIGACGAVVLLRPDNQERIYDIPCHHRTPEHWQRPSQHVLGVRPLRDDDAITEEFYDRMSQRASEAHGRFILEISCLPNLTCYVDDRRLLRE